MESTKRWREMTPCKFYLLLKDQIKNELPKEIVHAKSINSFENKLDEAWKDLPIKLYEQERFIEAWIGLRIYHL